MRTFDGIWDTIANEYVYEDYAGVDWEQAKANYRPLVEQAASEVEYVSLIDEMLSMFPLDTVAWQSRGERIEAETAYSEVELASIGAFVSYRENPRPHLVILSIVPDSPAQRAGLADHDSIYAIDGEPIRAEEGQAAAQRLVGPVNSVVVLEVDSPEGYLGNVNVRRGTVDAEGQRRFLTSYDELSGILYIRIPQLGYDGLDFEILSTLQAFQQAGQVRALIFDLRIASTGVVWPLDNLLRIFNNGNLGVDHARGGETEVTVIGDSFLNSQILPIAILVGPDTRGAPEVFAAAMQANGRAIIIGLPTPGLIELAQSYPLPDGSSLTIATRSFRSATGAEIGLTGVQPDILIEADWDAVLLGDDPVIFAAVNALLTGQ